MKWQGVSDEALIEQERALERWHTVFAFLPHRAFSGRIVWLERIQRRQVNFGSWPYSVWEWRECNPTEERK